MLLPALVLWAVPAAWPRWAFMWTLAASIFAGCKWLTWRRTPVEGATAARHLGYLLAWPGLDAAAFLDPRAVASRPSRGEWILALGTSALGAGLVFGAARLVPARLLYVVGWVGMLGIVLTLHFGTFHVLSCAWRSAGVDARPLMNAPLLSASVGEFWGRRWNTAFRDLTHRFVFRPLADRLGPRGGILAGFVVSGLVHEAVISVPAGGGYGGPSAFFVLQGAAMLVERSRLGRRLLLRRGWRGRAFTMLVLVPPVVLLFHPPFVNEVVLPFLRALGAI